LDEVVGIGYRGCNKTSGGVNIFKLTKA